MDDMVQRCYDELKDIFTQMKHTLVGVDGGTKVFDILLKTIADQYPPEVTIEAYRKMLIELGKND